MSADDAWNRVTVSQYICTDTYVIDTPHGEMVFLGGATVLVSRVLARIALGINPD